MKMIGPFLLYVIGKGLILVARIVGVYVTSKINATLLRSSHGSWIVTGTLIIMCNN